MINTEYFTGTYVVIALTIAILIILLIIWLVDISPLGLQLEQELINSYNDSEVYPILYEKIMNNEEICTINDFWGFETLVKLPKYGSITPITEKIIIIDINTIIEEQFN